MASLHLLLQESYLTSCDYNKLVKELICFMSVINRRQRAKKRETERERKELPES